MRQIVYFSTAAQRQDAVVMAGILAVSRERNLHDRVTGLLVAGGHRYLQVIEGSSDAIKALISRIRGDERHVGMSVLVDRRIDQRSFDGWSMAHTEEPELNEFATFRDLAGAMRATIADRKLRDQVECFADTFATSPMRTDAPLWRRAYRVPRNLDGGLLADLDVDRRH